MAENKTTRTVTLPDSHWQVIAQEAIKQDLTEDQLLCMAIRQYQYVNWKLRHGHTQAFVDSSGQLIKEPIFGCPAFD